ncbi:MAG: hypothetical protein Q8M31_23355 [Beijerinckiaceae bacterium]|nr:hypothetical protein [Beijerinckiaceae bacterium]
MPEARVILGRFVLWGFDMLRFGMVCAAGLMLAGCNAAGDADLNLRAYTACLDQTIGQSTRNRGGRQAAVQRAFNACKPQEQALLAATTARIGAEGASKAVSDGKSAYSRRVVAAGR